jgi:integrase
VENQWIETAPIIRNPVKTPKPRNRWATKEEAARILAACHEPHLRTFVALGFMTAARTAAILELRWDQVGERTIDFGEGHGNKRRAVVPIENDLAQILAVSRALRCTD